MKPNLVQETRFPLAMANLLETKIYSVFDYSQEFVTFFFVFCGLFFFSSVKKRNLFITKGEIFTSDGSHRVVFNISTSRKFLPCFCFGEYIRKKVGPPVF